MKSKTKQCPIKRKSKPPPPFVISLSHPFTVKNRCKYCGSNDLEVGVLHGRPPWKDLKYERNLDIEYNIIKWIIKVNEDYKRYLYRNYPKSIKYTRSNFFKGFNPRLYRNFKYIILEPKTINLYCANCNIGEWSYSDVQKRELPENVNRKSRINSPIKARRF